MAVDYGSESNLFHAPVMRIDDAGHGLVGVVYQADTRQSVDFKTGKLKWFHNKKLVLDDNKPGADARPALDFIFHIAVEKGRGSFTKYDADGEAIKLSSGLNATEPRDVVQEDVAIVASAAWFTRAVKSVKLNEGHRVRIKRITPARDENGDRMTDVQAEIEILGKVDDPKPYKAPQVAADAMYEEDPF